jgi:hypothetical protein
MIHDHNRLYMTHILASFLLYLGSIPLAGAAAEVAPAYSAPRQRIQDRTRAERRGGSENGARSVA